ncbi:uncharacterized protein LOC127002298 [Eriocheir sinensis]|uniref:uncharacterized protein LOC127002298 n=1 Tax=Eriocheir sinensis TaxID=95602 RepID=UPI0021C64447|nr:uncharacterized protein LOC127002298 [Eriocheir sinensis]
MVPRRFPELALALLVLVAAVHALGSGSGQQQGSPANECPDPFSFNRRCIWYHDQCTSDSQCSRGEKCCLVAGCGRECMEVSQPLANAHKPSEGRGRGEGIESIILKDLNNRRGGKSRQEYTPSHTLSCNRTAPSFTMVPRPFPELALALLVLVAAVHAQGSGSGQQQGSPANECPDPFSFNVRCIRYHDQCTSDSQCSRGEKCCLVAGCGRECMGVCVATSAATSATLEILASLHMP